MYLIVDIITNVNGKINGFVWGAPMLGLIIFTGIYFSIRLKFFQITHFKEVINNTIKSVFVKDKKVVKEKNVLSQFQALTTALASTIGTGNIAGVSTAIVVGGPGAVFWMWLCAIFGMLTHFAEVILGIYYRKYDKKDGYSGGPMYYLEKGVGEQLGFKNFGKILAVLFAIFTFLASFGIGNMTQINSISEALHSNFGVPTLTCGIVIAILVGIIIIGGVSRIGMVAEKVVPFMALFYIVIGILIVVLNFKNIPFVFKTIISGAFNFQAIAGGTLGTVISRAITYGFKRGAFSNEAGLGSSVIAHTASSEKEPVKQGFWGIFEVFFDTIIVCTITSIIVLSSTIKAPSIYEQFNDLSIEEKIVCVDDSLKNENGEVMLVDNNFYKMPIKLDANNNAKVHTTLPEDGKEYQKIVAYGNEYYVEKMGDEGLNDNSFFFGNVLKLYANPLYDTNKNIIYDDNNTPVIDSIHIENINGVSLVTLAVSNKLSHVAGKLLAIAITLFAFTTLLGWSYYGTKTIEYLGGLKARNIYKIFFIFFIVVGATMSLNLVWDIADTFNGLMAIPNLIGVLLLSGQVIKIVKNFYTRKGDKNVEPMISYYKNNNEK